MFVRTLTTLLLLLSATTYAQETSSTASEIKKDEEELKPMASIGPESPEDEKAIEGLMIETTPGVKKGADPDPSTEDPNAVDPTVPRLQIRGSFARKGWVLTLEGKPIKFTGNRFSHEIPVTADRTRIEFLSTGPASKETPGEPVTQKAAYLVNLDSWHKYSGDPKVKKGPKNNFLRLHAQLGTYSYKETLSPPASQLGLALNVEYRRKIRPKVFALADASFTALPLGGTPEAFRFLKFSAMGGYVLLQKPTEELTLYLGLRHFQMMVASGDFGFKGATGIRLQPSYWRMVGDNKVVGYASIAPVSNFYGIVPSGGNMELVVGAGYELSTRAKPFMFTLEFSSIGVEIDGVTISGSAISAGFSYPLF